jgi:predicted oxidoreductase
LCDPKIPITWDGGPWSVAIFWKRTDNLQENAMATLHIQHPITDLDTWTSAFNRFADVRRKAGVRAQRVQRPVDNPKFVVIDLDFDSTGEAQSFQGFLTTQVWANQENSPGLAGTPETMILEPVAI